MEQNGHVNKITLSANTNTLKAVVILEDYQADFQAVDSMSSVLGFNTQVFSNHYQESENPVSILSTNSFIHSFIESVHKGP